MVKKVSCRPRCPRPWTDGGSPRAFRHPAGSAMLPAGGVMKALLIGGTAAVIPRWTEDATPCSRLRALARMPAMRRTACLLRRVRLPRARRRDHRSHSAGPRKPDGGEPGADGAPIPRRLHGQRPGHGSERPRLRSPAGPRRPRRRPAVHGLPPGLDAPGAAVLDARRHRRHQGPEPELCEHRGEHAADLDPPPRSQGPT